MCLTTTVSYPRCCSAVKTKTKHCGARKRPNPGGICRRNTRTVSITSEDVCADCIAATQDAVADLFPTNYTWGMFPTEGEYPEYQMYMDARTRSHERKKRFPITSWPRSPELGLEWKNVIEEWRFDVAYADLEDGP